MPQFDRHGPPVSYWSSTFAFRHQVQELFVIYWVLGDVDHLFTPVGYVGNQAQVRRAVVVRAGTVLDLEHQLLFIASANRWRVT